MIRIVPPKRWRELTRLFGASNMRQVRKNANEHSGQNARRLLLQTGLAGQDPYGQAWQPRVLSYSHPILRKTGAMMRTTTSSGTPARWMVQYGHKRSLWHHYGTGIYGKRRRPIKPKRAKVLRYQHNGQTIFARSVRGVHKRPLVPTAQRRWPTNWLRMMQRTWEADLKTGLRYRG